MNLPTRGEMLFENGPLLSLQTWSIGLLGSEVARRTRCSLGVYITRLCKEYGVESVDCGVFAFDLRGSMLYLDMLKNRSPWELNSKSHERKTNSPVL